MITQNHQLSENDPFEMDFDQSAINIGSHPDNDIVLKGAAVRPFHVVLILQDGECQVIPLDSDAEIRLDGKLVETAQFKLAGAVRRLVIGENTLLLEPNKTLDGLRVRVHASAFSDANIDGQPKNAAQFASSGSSTVDSPILLNPFSQTDEVEVGQTATYEIEVVNAGTWVASFRVLVEGVPQDWISISPEEINLYEGERKRVRIAITPPRQPDSTAGQHDLIVSVTSPNYPDHQPRISIPLQIKPYYEFTLGNLSPREQRVSSWRKNNLVSTSLPITNMGNSPADFLASANDDENGCSFDLVLADGVRHNRQAALHIPAGQTLEQPIEISPHKRRWINGKRYSYTTTVQVTNQPAAPQMVSGSLSNHPLFPWWLIFSALISVALVVFFVFQPGINYFRADKTIIVLGDSIKLDGSVSFVTDRASISDSVQPLNTGKPLNNGQTSLTIAPTQTTTYDLIAGNWLSGLLRMDRRESITVLVVPPSPTINEFTVDNTNVAEGKPVKIRWSAQADQAILRAGDFVTELSKDQLNGEKDVLLTRDSLVTIEAKSAGGQALRSYFVHVQQPEIRIKKFIVWVKPSTKTGMPAQHAVGKLAALSQSSSTQADIPPDLNFSDKYVELNCSTPDTLSIPATCRVVYPEPGRELDKGEEVVVQWHVVGAESNKVQIAPFPETLPDQGSRSYFPDESMPFTLTAKSGGLEARHMLNVNVFTGSPPAAPKIDFFQAVPVAMVGKGDVKFSWSISGNWTRIQLKNSEKIIVDSDTDSANVLAQGFKTVSVSQSDTYILTAWNGDLTAAKPLDITISPALIKATLQITGIYPNSDRFLVGNKITVSISLTNIPSNKPYPTGDVTVTDGVSTCSITLPALSCDLVFKAAGDKQLWASYGGDTIYSQGTSAKYPSGSKIHVSSPTVKLTPRFYLTNGNGVKVGGALDIINQQFKMNQELYVAITVTPTSAVLPDSDDKSKVTLSICKQSDSGSCNVLSVVVVAVKDNIGTANILIKNFPGAGLYSLRVDYRHDDNLLAPASEKQDGIQVSKLGIYLTLPPSPACSKLIPDSAQNPVTCSFSYSDTTRAHVVFNIRQNGGGDYLETTMPAPRLVLNNKSFWQVYENNSKNAPFNCAIDKKVVQGLSVYVLDCVVDAVGKANLFVNYAYDNKTAPDYFMGDSPLSFARNPFYLRPAGKTIIEFNASDYSVGQIISLTPDKDLRLLDGDTKAKITNVTGKLTFSSNVNDLFDVVPGSTCSVNANGSAIVNIDVDEKCQIFFRKVSSDAGWDVQINFSGDDNNAATSKSVAGIHVKKQDAIQTAWFYSDDVSKNPHEPWDNIATITSAKFITGKIIFTGPAGFSSKSLNGVQLSFTMDDNGNSCVLDQPTAQKITYTNQQASFQFVVTCPKSPVKAKLEAAFIGLDTANFAFDVANVTRQVLFADQTSIGNVYFTLKRVNDSTKDNFNFDWKTAPSPKKIPLLFAGETYRIHLMYQPIWIDANVLSAGSVSCPGLPSDCVTLDDLLDFIQYDHYKDIHRSIDITLPDGLMSNITAVNGRCSMSNGKISVPLGYRRLFDQPYYWNYVELSSPDLQSDTNPNDYRFDDLDQCTVTFGLAVRPKVPLGKGDSATFSLGTNKDFNEPTTGFVYSADDSYGLDGLTKALVGATFNKPFNTKAKVGSAAQTVVMTLTNLNNTDRPPLTNDNLNTWFDVGYPSCMSLSGTVDSANNKVTWIMTPPATQYPCTGTLSVYYKENAYFGRKPVIFQTVQFAAP